jgi:hypothetical protein
MATRDQTGLVHVPEIGNDTMPGATFGADRFYQSPVVVALAVLLNRDLAEEHAANIQHRTARAQEAEFSLHDTFEEKLTSFSAIANFEREMIKHIFQLSNLG